MSADAILVKCAGECGKLARVAPEADECQSCGGPLSTPDPFERHHFELEEARDSLASVSAQLRTTEERLRAAKPKADLFDRMQSPEVRMMSVAGALQHLNYSRFEALAFNVAALDHRTDDPRTVLALVITMARAAIQGIEPKDVKS